MPIALKEAAHRGSLRWKILRPSAIHGSLKKRFSSRLGSKLPQAFGNVPQFGEAVQHIGPLGRGSKRSEIAPLGPRGLVWDLSLRPCR